MDDQPAYIPPPGPGAPPPPTEKPTRTRRGSPGVLGWIIGAAIVLILAVAGGLFTAWIVANLRAVPGPAALVTPTPTVSASLATAAPSAEPTTAQTEPPRRTPTPEPTVELTPTPFVHVVQKGESLTYIANLYEVEVQDIIDLNNIKNPNRIQVGQEILIPGYGVQPTPKPEKTPKPGKTPKK
jgi:LysM repeat protein